MKCTLDLFVKNYQTQSYLHIRQKLQNPGPGDLKQGLLLDLEFLLILYFTVGKSTLLL